MKSEIHPKVVANFFLDGAKIIFGSLVVGAFVPSIAAAQIPWSNITLGIVFTAAFFGIANAAAHKEDDIKISQPRS